MLTQQDINKIVDGRTDEETYPLPPDGLYPECWEEVDDFDELALGDFVIIVDPDKEWDAIVGVIKTDIEGEKYAAEYDECRWYEWEIHDGDICIYALRNPINLEEANVKIEFDSLL